MSKEIWLSPVLGNSRERLVERCAEMIKRGETHRFLYLTASHPLLELVTKWILDFDEIRGVMGTLPIFLFRGFVRHVLTSATEIDTGLTISRRTPIDVDESNLKKSLLSQIMRRLVASGGLKALAPLAHRAGTVNNIATLVGEIQRAAKRPEEFRAIIEKRAGDLINSENENGAIKETNQGNFPRQLDFDREICLIYEAYVSALEQFQLTEVDADQLRALQIFDGQIDSKQVTIPWLGEVDLLILDGFFDFTPVQGEILRRLIPRVPNVIVNLYGDNENEEVFRPFAETLEQLRSMSDEFSDPIHQPLDSSRASSAIRIGLFNPEFVPEQPNLNVEDAATRRNAEPPSDNRNKDEAGPVWPDVRLPRLFRCRDRETEVRAIAKEIKRLVLVEKFSIREIALVVRQRASYSEAIARVFADESIPCTIERTVDLAQIPAVRAVLKLFQILADERDSKDPRVTDLADLIKSGYFRLSEESIRELRGGFGSTDEPLLQFETGNSATDSRRSGYANSSLEDRGFGSWNPDELENVFAYVGSDLRLNRWLERAAQLASNEASAVEVRAQIFGVIDEETDDNDEVEKPEEDVEPSSQSSESAGPSREIHPTLLKWAALLLSKFAEVIKSTPREDEPASLRIALLTLVENLQFAKTIRRSLTDLSLESALPHAALDLRALEGVREATSWAIQSIEIAANVAKGSETTISLEDFIAEVERCIDTQSLTISSADLDGLQVLEATDVRGLQFRAIFVAGLIEGGFPLRKPRDWIYPHEERERLKDYGLTLEDISPATLLKEEHYFYQTVARATERLYLTWPLVLEGDTETVPSYYIDELKHALAPREIKSEDMRRAFEGDDLFDSSSQAELATTLVRLAERHIHRGRKRVPVVSTDVAKLLAWAEETGIVTSSAQSRIAIGHQRSGTVYGRHDGMITNDGLRTLLAERFGSDYVWSASALSLFGKSPFKFFAERVLKLEPRTEAALDLAVLDAGGLLHEALRRFFTKHRGKRLAKVNRLKLREEMHSIADQVFRERERAVPPLNVHVWRIDREIYQLQLARVVDYEIDLQAKNETDGVQPSYFELGFGMEHGIRDEESTPDFLVMIRPGTTKLANDSIKLRGQIDRIDVAEDGTLIAYDYKLSRGASEKDMIDGRDLQMGIYLDAIEELFFKGNNVAGGGYYVLRSCDRNRGLYRKAYDSYTHLGSSVRSRFDDDNWFEHRATMRSRIWQFVDKIRAGRFVVDPTAPEQTCGNCDYAAVCRYEKFRILRKTGGV